MSDAIELKGQRKRGNAVTAGSTYVTITAAATTTPLHTISAGRRCIVRKIRWHNLGVANVGLQIGYDTNAVAPVWTPVLPNILMLAGIDGELTEDQIPIVGNDPEGFFVDTTITTGFAGVIAARITAAVAAGVQVSIEVEEI